MVALFVGKGVQAQTTDRMSFEMMWTGGNSASLRNGWLQASGPITPETPDDLRRFLEEHDYSPAIVRLSSQGGDLGAALALGRMLRDLGVETEVGRTDTSVGFDMREEAGVCVSACAYAFLGGMRRLLERDDALGFHQFYDARALRDTAPRQTSGTERVLESSDDQRFTGLIVDYLIEMDIDLNLYGLASAVSPNDPMLFVDREQAINLRIDNFQDTGGPWRVVAFGDGLISEFETNVSERIYRLYCTQGGDQYLTVFTERPLPTNQEAIVQMFRDPASNLQVVASGRPRPLSFVESGWHDGLKRQYYVFAVDLETVEALAQADRWEFSVKAMRSFYDLVATRFGVIEIVGDRRLPRQVMRACI